MQPGISNSKSVQRWASPLDVSFSQNVLYPKFSDGRSVDEAVHLIRETPCEDAEYDLTLEHPFPAIEVVWWTPKLRDGQGKPLLDKDGSERLAREKLFTLDNRRLYALQRAAVMRFPQKCRVAVGEIVDKSEVMRHLKKMRTRTVGLSVSVSEWSGTGRDNAKDYNTMRVWDWRSAVAPVEFLLRDAEERVHEAADSGKCGAWEYLDGKGEVRGPFSTWQMRQWWERKMLPPELKVRQFRPNLAKNNNNAGGDGSNTLKEAEPFNLVTHLWQAPVPAFAPGLSPRNAGEGRETFTQCQQCNRKRCEGWSTRGGEWYCISCWNKWQRDRTQEADEKRHG
mmetsp:Transcript_20420/g.47618  ORF Transcript_20420/g.47618 Transcript_20420/m.47618 type:complete len:338 (+) Transcript_20420:62-1075(+)